MIYLVRVGPSEAGCLVCAGRASAHGQRLEIGDRASGIGVTSVGLMRIHEVKVEERVFAVVGGQPSLGLLDDPSGVGVSARFFCVRNVEAGESLGKAVEGVDRVVRHHSTSGETGSLQFRSPRGDTVGDADKISGWRRQLGGRSGGEEGRDGGQRPRAIRSGLEPSPSTIELAQGARHQCVGHVIVPQGVHQQEHQQSAIFQRSAETR